jgi:hypothetical protein
VNRLVQMYNKVCKDSTQVMLIILLTSILVPMKGRNSCERETTGNPSQSLCEIKVVVVSAPQAAAAGRHR